MFLVTHSFVIFLFFLYGLQDSSKDRCRVCIFVFNATLIEKKNKYHKAKPVLIRTQHEIDYIYGVLILPIR